MRSGVPARGHTPALGPAPARPPPAARRPLAGAPRPHLLPLPHPRGRAPRSAARLPGPCRAAAAAAPARQPAPRRAHGARTPHFLSPRTRPAEHSPAQGPAAAAARGEARRWDRPAGSAAQRNRAGAGAAGRRADGHQTRGRSSEAAGAGRPSPWAGRADPGRRWLPVTSESWNAGGGGADSCARPPGRGRAAAFFNPMTTYFKSFQIKQGF